MNTIKYVLHMYHICNEYYFCITDEYYYRLIGIHVYLTYVMNTITYVIYM